MAENDGKIYITISNRQNGSGGEQPGAPEESKSNKKTNLFVDYAKHQFFNTIKASATKAVNYSIQNYGNFTGDYQTQRQLEDAKTIVNTIAGYGTAFITGMAASGGNPAGGLIAVGAKLALDVGNVAMGQISTQMSINAQNYSINQLKQLSGLNTLLDGSRGTLN